YRLLEKNWSANKQKEYYTYTESLKANKDSELKLKTILIELSGSMLAAFTFQYSSPNYNTQLSDIPYFTEIDSNNRVKKRISLNKLDASKVNSNGGNINEQSDDNYDQLTDSDSESCLNLLFSKSIKHISESDGADDESDGDLFLGRNESIKFFSFDEYMDRNKNKSESIWKLKDGRSIVEVLN
ncbi:17177_t:CDS:2, partial [Funneliformis geosporum]